MPDKIEIETLTTPEKKFIMLAREYGWGTIEVEIRNGQPVMIAPVVRDGVVQHKTKLD